MSLCLSLALQLVDQAAPVASGPPPPTLASLNYTQADVLGGGSDIVATGTNLAGASAVTVGGTPATITGTTATTVSFTPPAKAAGTYDVTVTTPDGNATLSSALEAWAPSTDAACTWFAEAPNYNGGTGTWATRVGTAATSSPAATASAGAPVFDGVGYLDGPALNTLMGTSAGTVAIITSHTNNGVLNTATPFNNPAAIALTANGTCGISFGTDGGVQSALFHMLLGGSYRSALVPTTLGASLFRSYVGRWDTTTGTEINVDGGAFSTPVGSGAWTSTNGALKIGGQYNAAMTFRGTEKAVVILNAKASSTFATKFYKWAQQRHGVA